MQPIRSLVQTYIWGELELHTHVSRVEEVVEDKVVGEEAATAMEKVEMEEGEEVKVMEQVAVEAALVMEVNESES